jgi:hypothetical protein
MRKRTRATGNCAFCGRRDSLTYEHATPKWLGKFIHEHFPPENRWEQVAISFGTDRERAQSTKLIQSASPHKAAVVCGECNNGWMRRLEDAVRPILRPLILGKQSELDDAAIRTVATWATKTALIYEFVQPDDAQPAASATDRTKRLHTHRAKGPTTTTTAAIPPAIPSAKGSAPLVASIVSQMVGSPATLGTTRTSPGTQSGLSAVQAATMRATPA